MKKSNSHNQSIIGVSDKDHIPTLMSCRVNKGKLFKLKNHHSCTQFSPR